MNFFRLYHSSDKHEIGFYPQVHDALVIYDIYEPYSSYHLQFEKANNNTLWPVSKLSRKAKRTDLVSVSFMGLSDCLLISDKLYSCISGFLLEGLQCIKTRLVTEDGKDYAYWIVNAYENCLMNLDPIESSFSYLRGIGSSVKLSEPNFKDQVSLMQAFEQDKMNARVTLENHMPLVIDKIAFKKELAADFFAISPVTAGGIGFFVSDRLRASIEAAECTGIVFTEINARYP